MASARATVEVLDSIKDAIRDESESSDSSSEADDEGGDEDEARKPTDKTTMDSSPEQSVTLPIVTVHNVTDTSSPAPAGEPSPPPSSSTPPLPPPARQLGPVASFPPSPFLQSEIPMNLPPTPPPISLDEPGRNSIFKQAFQGLSQGLFSAQFPPRRSDPEAEDPLNDPEHIFRDSSMVVRTDEPTSIIALALKYVICHLASCLSLIACSSSQYREILAKSRAEKRTAREPKLTDGGEAFMPDDHSVAESSSTWGVVNVETAEPGNPAEELKSASTKMPWVISQCPCT